MLFGAGLYAHAFLYNFYLDALGLSEGVMGLAASLLTAGGLAALVPAGVLVDRAGTRVAYGASALLGAAGLAAGALVREPLAIYAAAFAGGAGTAGWRVSMGPAIMQLTDPSIRSRAFSWNVAFLVGSGAFWVAAAGQVPVWIQEGLGVSRLTGLRVGLLAGAVGTALAGAVFVLLPGLDGRRRRPVHRTQRTASRGIADGLRIPVHLALVVAVVALWMTAGGLVIPFFNLYFLRVHGLPVDQIGWLFAGVQVVTALVLFGSGTVADRAGTRRTLFVWMLAFAPALWGLALVGALAPAAFLYLIQNLVPPATNPLIDQILLEEVPEERQGAISSWRNGATEISGLVGSAAGGFVLEAAGFAVLLGGAGVVGLVGALALIVALRRPRSAARTPGAGAASDAGAVGADGGTTVEPPSRPAEEKR